MKIWQKVEELIGTKFDESWRPEVGVVDAKVMKMLEERVGRGIFGDRVAGRAKKNSSILPETVGACFRAEGNSEGRSGRIPGAMRRGAIGSWDAERHTGWPP